MYLTKYFIIFILILPCFSQTIKKLDSTFYTVNGIIEPTTDTELWIGNYSIEVSTAFPSVEVEFVRNGLPQITPNDVFGCFKGNKICGEPQKLSDTFPKTNQVNCRCSKSTDPVANLNYKWWSYEKKETFELQFLEGTLTSGTLLPVDIYFPHGSTVYQPASYEPYVCSKCSGTSNDDKCIASTEPLFSGFCVKDVIKCKGIRKDNSPSCSSCTIGTGDFCYAGSTVCRGCKAVTETEICNEENNNTNFCLTSVFNTSSSCYSIPTLDVNYKSNSDTESGIYLNKNSQL